MEKKLWSNAEIVELGVKNTKDDLDEKCPYLNFFEVRTPIPNGPDGVENCPWWNGSGCTHKNYGKGNQKNWPCSQAQPVIS